MRSPFGTSETSSRSQGVNLANRSTGFHDGSYTYRYLAEPQIEARNALLHAPGNLTITTGALNTLSGNGGFVEKRDTYDKHTMLYLNKWFLKKSDWNNDDIRARSEHLAGLALQRWSGLLGYTSGLNVSE